MTTDTRPKESLSRGSGFVVGGMAKGSGMIHPNLATMLAVVTTDYPLEPGEAIDFLRPAVDASFNAISVDGECSTNDTVLLLANGASGVERTPASDEQFALCLRKVCADLARQIVADGEGATVLAEIAVRGAATDAGGAGDRRARRDVAAREDGAARPRRELGADRCPRPARRAGRTATRGSIPTCSRSSSTACRCSSPAARPATSRSSRTATARSSSTSRSAAARRRTSRPTCPTSTCPSTRTTARDLLVLKVGGASVERIELPAEPCVVVHGAGPQISEEMARRGLEPEFVGGRRVTTPEVLEIVRESFAAVNAAVCAAIGPRALPLYGDEIGLLAEPPAGARARRDGGSVRARGDRRRARRRARPGRHADGCGPAQRQRRRDGGGACGRARRREAALPHRRRRASSTTASCSTRSRRRAPRSSSATGASRAESSRSCSPLRGRRAVASSPRSAQRRSSHEPK